MDGITGNCQGAGAVGAESMNGIRAYLIARAGCEKQQSVVLSYYPPGEDKQTGSAACDVWRDVNSHAAYKACVVEGKEQLEVISIKNTVWLRVAPITSQNLVNTLITSLDVHLLR